MELVMLVKMILMAMVLRMQKMLALIIRISKNPISTTTRLSSYLPTKEVKSMLSGR